MASKQRFSLEVEESVLQCIIHRGVMEDPRLLQCHHSFCLGCLEKWYRQGGRTYQVHGWCTFIFLLGNLYFKTWASEEIQSHICAYLLGSICYSVKCGWLYIFLCFMWTPLLRLVCYHYLFSTYYLLGGSPILAWTCLGAVLWYESEISCCAHAYRSLFGNCFQRPEEFYQIWYQHSFWDQVKVTSSILCSNNLL